MIYKKLRYAQPSWLICPPLSVRWDVIALFHDALAHGGISQTLYQLHQHFHWVGIKGDVTTYVNTCETCQKVKASPLDPPEIQTPINYGPLQHVHMDLMGPLDRADGTKAWICVMTDYFMKTVEKAIVASQGTPGNFKCIL
jgi:hypothetical protein